MSKTTWLGALNFYVFQWFGVRVARVLDDVSGRPVRWTVITAKPLAGYDGRPWR